jgi:hypothetical protein
MTRTVSGVGCPEERMILRRSWQTNFITESKWVIMDKATIIKNILVALVLSIALPAVAQHRGHYGGGYASPVYVVPYVPPMMAPYNVSPRVYASGTRDTSSDRLSYVPPQLPRGMSDIEYRATILSRLYASGAISSQQYQEIWNRIASER